MTATPDYALQRTALCVTAPPSIVAIPAAMQVPRREPAPPSRLLLPASAFSPPRSGRASCPGR